MAYLNEQFDVVTRDRSYTNLPESLNLRTFNESTSHHGLKVVDEPHLAGLGHAFFVSKTPISKEFSAIRYVVEHPCIEEKASASSTSSAFATVTVDRYQMLGVLLEKSVHLVDKLEEKSERRSMVILPRKVINSAVKQSLVI